MAPVEPTLAAPPAGHTAYRQFPEMLRHVLVGDGAYAAGWNGFAPAGGPDMNTNIGYVGPSADHSPWFQCHGV